MLNDAFLYHTNIIRAQNLNCRWQDSKLKLPKAQNCSRVNSDTKNAKMKIFRKTFLNKSFQKPQWKSFCFQVFQRKKAIFKLQSQITGAFVSGAQNFCAFSRWGHVCCASSSREASSWKRTTERKKALFRIKREGSCMFRESGSHLLASIAYREGVDCNRKSAIW